MRPLRFDHDSNHPFCMLSKNIPPGAFMIRKHPPGKFIRPRAYTRDAPSPGIASLRHLIKHFRPRQSSTFPSFFRPRASWGNPPNPWPKKQLLTMALTVNPFLNSIATKGRKANKRPESPAPPKPSRATDNSPLDLSVGRVQQPQQPPFRSIKAGISRNGLQSFLGIHWHPGTEPVVSATR
jgi:hypothetical protein